VDKTANTTPGYRFVTLFQLLCRGTRVQSTTSWHVTSSSESVSRSGEITCFVKWDQKLFTVTSVHSIRQRIKNRAGWKSHSGMTCSPGAIPSWDIETRFSSVQNSVLEVLFPPPGAGGDACVFIRSSCLGPALAPSALLHRFLTRVAGSAQTTGKIPGPQRSGTILSVESLLFALDLQDGGVVVQDGQDDFVHVLSQAYVDFLLLLQGLHQLQRETFVQYVLVHNK